jgi:hypothetical protein
MTPIHLAHQRSEASVNARQMPHDFRDSNHGNVFGVGYDLATSGPHPLATHSEETQIRVATAQSFDELRAIEVARSLTGGNQNVRGLNGLRIVGEER